MKFPRVAAVMLTFSLFPCPGLIAGDGLKPLSKKLLSGLKGHPKILCAVLNFPYVQNRSSTGSHLVSERLVTYLVQDGANIVERRLLEKILEERKLWETGLMGPEEAKKVSNLVGADAVVTGILTDLSESTTEVLARIVKIDTGEIISAASAIINRIWRDPPRLPRIAQPRSAVPGAYIPTNTKKESSQPQRSRQGQRQRYYPSAVPFLMPSPHLPTQGGSAQ